MLRQVRQAKWRLAGGCRPLSLVFLLVFSGPALGRISPEQYRDVGVTLPSAAAVPLSAAVTDETGRKRALRELVTRPTVLVFADYTCRTLCGPIVAFVAAALRQSGLRPGEDFALLAIGLDPKDGAAEATQMRRAHLGDDSALNGATVFATADAGVVDALTAALGYRFRYDTDADQYVHPAAAYVLGGDGKVARVLTG